VLYDLCLTNDLLLIIFERTKDLMDVWLTKTEISLTKNFLMMILYEGLLLKYTTITAKRKRQLIKKMALALY
jgi:hypothetical protein